MPIYIVMGVSGSGKSTMAQKFANAVVADWLDADAFHTAEKKSQMAAGIPLTDADRWPWLDRLNAELRDFEAEGKTVFLACSALKQRYRDRLVAGLPEARFIYLKGSPEVIRARLEQRRNHFMPPSLLQSQLADLEEPQDALVLDVSRTEKELVEDFRRTL